MKLAADICGGGCVSADRWKADVRVTEDGGLALVRVTMRTPQEAAAAKRARKAAKRGASAYARSNGAERVSAPSESQRPATVQTRGAPGLHAAGVRLRALAAIAALGAGPR